MVQDSVIFCAPGVTVRAVGLSGRGALGVPVTRDQSPPPAALTARRRNWYSVKLTRPVIPAHILPLEGDGITVTGTPVHRFQSSPVFVRFWYS